jgi:type VI protein secretion system component VasK
MNATLAFPVWIHAHRAERVTNISPASDAFVLVTLATLFFTIGCFTVWMWFIWRRGRRTQPPRTEAQADEMQTHEPVAQSSEPAVSDTEKQPAPWEKPADWWKQ